MIPDPQGFAVIQWLMQQTLLSCMLFLFILPLSLLFKRQPRLQMGLWSLVLLRLFLPPDLTVPLSGRDLAGNLPGVNVLSDWVRGMMSGEKPVSMVWIDGEQEGWPGIPGLEESGARRSRRTNRVLDKILLTLYLTGAAAVMAVIMRRWRRYHRALKQAELVQHAGINRLLDKWRARFNVRRRVFVVSSKQGLQPFTACWRRPLIYLPEPVVRNGSRRLLEPIIAHEMAHIKRADSTWIVLQNIAVVLYFYHPLVWLANAQINYNRECLCDQMVMSKNEIEPAAYGESLLTILRLKFWGGLNLQPHFRGPGIKWRRRLGNLKGGHSMSKSRLILSWIFIFICGWLLLPMGAAPDGAKYTVKETSVQFQRPIKSGKVSSPFGLALHPFKKREYFHRGVDIAAARGVEVYAAAEGRVLSAENDEQAYGLNIIISHANDVKTRYAHLDTLLVTEGEHVAAGVTIGRVGSTGLATGPHLHFELLVNDEAEDPSSYIDFE